MTGTHVAERLMEQYARGESLPADVVWAVEAHLEDCAECRSALADARIPALTGITDVVRERMARELAGGTAPRRTRRTAWLVPASRSLVPALLLVVLTAAGLSALAAAPLWGARIAALLTAPVLPVLGVLATCSRSADPAYEIVTVAARAGLGLVLRRTLAVLAVALPVVALVSLVIGPAVTVMGMLLPALACTGAALALGGYVGVERASISVLAVWAIVVGGPALVSQLPAPVALGTPAVPVWAAIAAASAVLIAVRRAGYQKLRYSGR